MQIFERISEKENFLCRNTTIKLKKNKRKKENLLTSDIILRYFTGIQRVIIFNY